MSAELPHFGTIWEVSLDRRKFLRLLLGAAAGTAALSCLPQSLSQGSSSKENLSQEEYFPPRTKISEIVRWREEGPSYLKEIEAGAYLLGQFARLDSNAVIVRDVSGIQQQEFAAPVRSDDPKTISFSPDGKQLALWYRVGEYPNFKDHSFLIYSADGSLRKIDERETDAIFGQLVWSPDGNWLVVQSFPYAIVTERPFSGSTRLVKTESGKIVYSQIGAGDVVFSPDSQFLAHNSPTQLLVVNLQEGAIWRYPRIEDWKFFWSPDSQTLAFISRGKLILKNFKTGSEKRFGQNVGLVPFEFSPDGKRLCFVESSSGRSVMRALNLETEEIVLLPAVLNQFDWRWWAGAYFKSEEELVLGTIEKKEIRVFTINLKTGELINQKTIQISQDGSSYFYKFLNPYWISFLYLGPYPDLQAQFYLASLKTGQIFPIEGANYRYAQTEGIRNWDLQADALTDASVIKDGKRSFLFSGGRKYSLVPQTVEFFGKSSPAPKTIPTRTVEQIPESVNKLEFRGGDLLLDREGGVRYLRDGQRYPVVDLGSFQNNVQFNRQRYEVPQVILKRIPEGKDPLEGKSGFSDWDGHFVEAHREGSILLLFVKGWKSASDDGPSFPELKGGLKENNCSTDGRMAEFTYNTKRRPNGELELWPYDSTHAAAVPITPTKYLEWQVERYKKLLPWTKIILIAHSLGGWLAFNVALNQAEVVRAVITLDSPLKGINKTLIGDRGEAILRGLWGDEVVNFLIKMGDEVPEEAIERRAKMLQERGVEVFTFASTDDLLVPHQVAFLENRTQSLNGSSLNLRFPMGRLAGLDVPWINPFFTGDPREELKEWLNTVVTAHGTVTRHPEVIKTIAKIVGKISS